MAGTEAPEYKHGKTWSTAKIESKDLWHEICEMNSDEYGVRHCYTWRCPLAKKYSCYQYGNYDLFEKNFGKRIKELRTDIQNAAKEVEKKWKKRNATST